MTVIKTWVYDGKTSDITEQDIEYLRAAKIDIQFNNDPAQRIDYAGKVFYYQGMPSRIKFITVDQNSESMLLLRFSDKLFLLSMVYADKYMVQ